MQRHLCNYLVHNEVLRVFVKQVSNAGPVAAALARAAGGRKLANELVK